MAGTGGCWADGLKCQQLDILLTLVVISSNVALCDSGVGVYTDNAKSQ